MRFKPGIAATILIVLGAVLFLLSYFYTGYSARKSWTEDRAKLWTDASVNLHSLHGRDGLKGQKVDPHAQAELQAAQAKYDDLNQQKNDALSRSQWWASFLWGSGLLLMLGGVGLYGAMALGAMSENDD